MRLLLISICSLVPLWAQSNQTVREPAATLTVHGEATVSAQPDIAEIDIGVVSQGPTSQAASDDNVARTKKVSSQLEQFVPPGDLKSINISVNPNYSYPKDGGSGVIKGYTASNTLRVTVRQISRLRKIIETATQAGASSINRLSFDLQDENAARARALSKAAGQAQSGAEALAASLKLTIGRLVRVEEVQPVVISPAREVEVSALKEPMVSNAAIEPGTIQIHASVNLVYAVSPQ